MNVAEWEEVKIRLEAVANAQESVMKVCLAGYVDEWCADESRIDEW